VRLVGPCDWDPPAELPAGLEEVAEPIVLVTTSSEFQDDGRLVRCALEQIRHRVTPQLVVQPKLLPNQPGSRDRNVDCREELRKRLGRCKAVGLLLGCVFYFRRALDRGNVTKALSAASELSFVGLVEALELTLLLADESRTSTTALPSAGTSAFSRRFPVSSCARVRLCLRSSERSR
jgi:hypothetical protein